jgi:F-type H+-transporting ATPase subunit b
VVTREWSRLAVLACLLAIVCPAIGSEESGEPPNIFNADIGNFVATLIIFGLVVFTLGKFAWKPLLNVLNEREETIRRSLETAKREREEAEKLLAGYTAQIDKARIEASAIVEEGRRDSEEVSRRIHEDARKEAEEIIQRARREIQLATETAVKELYDQTAEVAVSVAAGIIREEISPERHRQLVAESLEAMKSSGKANMN